MGNVKEIARLQASLFMLNQHPRQPLVGMVNCLLRGVTVIKSTSAVFCSHYFHTRYYFHITARVCLLIFKKTQTDLAIMAMAILSRSLLTRRQFFHVIKAFTAYSFLSRCKSCFFIFLQ